MKLLAKGADVNHANQVGDTALMIASKNQFSKIVELITLRMKNLFDVEDITNKITNILAKETDWNHSSVIENKIITLLQNYEINLNINFPIFGLALYQFLKREFINSLIFGEENYSILHIVVLNDWLNLVFYLMSNWLIDVNYKDNSGNTAWNYASMLLQPKIALLIKTKDQLMTADKQF